MHEPAIQDKRLDAETMRQMDAFAAAEESGRESESLARALIADVSPLSPFRATVLERAVRYAYHYAPHRDTSPTPGFMARVIGRFVENRPRTITPTNAQGRWFRAMHPSGYVRQAVLQELDAPPPAPIFLAILLLCLDDHVPEVRAAAAACFRRLEHGITAPVIIGVVPYIVRRRHNWRNIDQAVIDALLARDEVRTWIRTLLLTGDEGWLPRFFRDLLATDIADPWLADLATSARHAAIRARATFVLMDGKVEHLRIDGKQWWAPRRVIQRAIEVEFDTGALIASGAGDRATAVRKAAAQGLVRHHASLPDTPVLLRAFGSEKNAAIRERLDFIRRKLAAG